MSSQGIQIVTNMTKLCMLDNLRSSIHRARSYLWKDLARSRFVRPECIHAVESEAGIFYVSINFCERSIGRRLAWRTTGDRVLPGSDEPYRLTWASVRVCFGLRP